MGKDLVLENFEKLTKSKEKKTYNQYNNFDVVEFRKDFFATVAKLLTKAYAEEGHKAWRYAFVNNCRKHYNVVVQYGTINDMESGEKNATSRMYILMLFEIERMYGVKILDKLLNLENE